jgi:iron complex outermembrane receptor protein
MPTTRPPGRRVTCVLISIFAVAPFTVADQPPGGTNPSDVSNLKQLSLEELSQVQVISPSKEPVPELKSPTAVYVITSEDIQRSGVTTIPDALRLAPGVEVAQIDGSKWAIGIRGFGSRLARSVLVLIDGREVYTPLFAGTYWEVQDTLLEDIDRIEVIRGPGGTIWGPNAVNGVINIITKNAKDTHGTYASAGGGNVDQGFFNFRYGGDDNGLDYRVYAKGFTRDSEEHPDHDNFDSWRGIQGGFRLDWTRGFDSFTVEGDAYKQEDGERVQLGNYAPPSEANIDGYEQLWGSDLVVRWRRTISDGNDVQIQAFYDRTDRAEPNLGENRDTGDIDYLERSKISERQELIYGLGANWSDGRFKEVGSGLVFSPFNQLDYTYTGFLEDDIQLVRDKLVLTAGSKILRTNYTGFNFEPSVRLLWTPTDKQSFWAAYTHALRTPSDAEEDFYLSSYLGTTASGTPEFARFNANSNFAPEQLNGYEAGYRRLILKNVYLDVALFFNHYHDLFSEDLAGPLTVQTTLPFPSTTPPPTYILIPAQFRNDLRGATMGGEIAPEWQVTKFWRLTGSYSFLNMSLNKAPGTGDLGTAPIIDGSSPRHEADVDSSFNAGKKLQIDLIYRYVSALPGQSVPSYSTGDARIAWQWNRYLQLAVAGANLFQPYHVEYIGDPGPPVGIRRSVYASLIFRKP